MATDDPRLNRLITEGDQAEVVIVGCPYDFLRKRSINKGGEDNGPCCLRRFYPKVGPLINPQYQIDINSLKVSDMGNVKNEISKEEEEEQFKNVATKRFKGQFVNYYKESPQKIIEKIGETLVRLVKNNQLPFVFGGSKEGLLASVDAFHQAFPQQKEKRVYICSGKPFLERPYDGNKATSENISTILKMNYPDTKFNVFGAHLKYFPSQFVIQKESEVSIATQKLSNFNFTLYPQIRELKINKASLKFGRRTQGLHKFIEIFKENELSQVNFSLEVLELFMGCRDVSVQGLTFEEFMEIMLFLGSQQKLKIISISQFNPSCEDYQSSLLILNALYYFLMGRAQLKATLP